MKALLWLLALFGLAVVVSVSARFNEGYLLLVLPSYRAEMTLNLALILGTLVFALLYGVLRALSLAARLPGQARDYRQRRRREEAAEAFAQAVQSLYAGQFSRALHQAEQAHALHGTETSAVTALLAADAASRLADPRQARVWLTRVDAGQQPSKIASLLLDAEIALEQGQFAAATASLQRLRAENGLRLKALRLQLRVERERGNWPEALRLARRLWRHRLLSEVVLNEIEHHAVLNPPPPQEPSAPLDATFFL
ncbi:MAG TPA: heme biosynthesis HemY N-terminal domain-containing protein [Accumulibacter sp.]|nr:heme biosynthesis HemY N-terminal domain-containing protein [Accumulibacter sp.]HMW16657.1 heme biosynthesis HemY N-terminal domain-containing protein [Accumulibacter sp.]HMY06981.1 heme biosynthesis HemY N-terminal domain-containing protein [Accumulibacter sp.]HNC17700.1 heme biosynthesis HemY N-terminal domain-containing protein [Accumulibacter sp.]HND79402.1 heme biosynthesis HemY N-terminal domain-containing protein [Accumulibacter sp.]